MWLPEETKFAIGSLGSGGQQFAGRISRPPQRQLDSSGGLGGPPREVITFRIETATNQTIHCRFEGTLSGLLDQGDQVVVTGRMDGGMLKVRSITDPHGVVLGQSACFIATVIYGDPMALEVQILRRFRDQKLARSVVGVQLIEWYWCLGPTLARRLRARPALCRIIRRILLDPLCHWLR